MTDPLDGPRVDVPRRLRRTQPWPDKPGCGPYDAATRVVSRAASDGFVTRHLAFQWHAVFPEEDPLSEWLVTLAIAMNDLTLVHVHLDQDQDRPERHFYWNRLALSHFTEVALFLEQTAAVPEVQAFVETLGGEAREHYDRCLGIFREQRGRLFDVRNKATFHYPELRPDEPQAGRPVRDSLVELREDRGVIRSARLRDARALFADDAVASIFIRVLGGQDAVDAFAARVADGVTAFIRFANLSLDEHLRSRRLLGAEVVEVQPVVVWEVIPPAGEVDGAAAG